MKRLLLFLVIPIAIVFTQCGEGAEDETVAKETVNLGNTVVIDLSEHGYPISIKVPAPDEDTPEATVEVLDWGAIEIRVDKYFQLQIADGEGNLADKKQDNIDMYDNIYTLEYLIEEESALLFKTEIPGLEPEFHFFVVVKTAHRTFEIEDVKEEIYSEEAARRMFDFAKAIKFKKQS